MTYYIIFSLITNRLLTLDVFETRQEAIEYIGSLNDQVIIRIRI